MTLPHARTRSWRYHLRGIVMLLCAWAGVLVGTGTHAAEHPTPRYLASSLSAPDDKPLPTVIGSSLSMATVRTDVDRGTFKPIYLAPTPQHPARLGFLFHTLERLPSHEQYVFRRCCVAQAGGTRAPPVEFPFPCLLFL